MAKFIKCSVEKTVRRGANYVSFNDPVNIDLIRIISKGDDIDNPDNPWICFLSGKSFSYFWYYPKESADLRDADYEKIVNNEF